MNNLIFFSFYSLAHRSPFLDKVLVFAANDFGLIMIFFAILFLFIHSDGNFDFHKPFTQLENKIKEIILFVSSGMTALVIAEVIKYIVAAPRPFVLFESVKPLLTEAAMTSYPSGHATFFSALAVFLYLRHKRIGILYIIIALIVGLARIAVGVHFPFDILSGFILGTIIALIFGYIFKKDN